MFVALTVALLGLGVSAASAETISGTLTDGDSFVATLTTTPGTPGTITGGSITVTGAIDPGTYSNVLFNGMDPYNPYPTYLFAVGSYSGPYFDLYFSGYDAITNGSPCTPSKPCGYDVTQFRPDSPNDYATIATLTPEPGTLLLAACGLAALGLLLRKRALTTS
jgi:hypothetical protein